MGYTIEAVPGHRWKRFVPMAFPYLVNDGTWLLTMCQTLWGAKWAIARDRRRKARKAARLARERGRPSTLIYAEG